MRLLILFTIISFSSFSQIGMGQWRFHMPSKLAIDVIALSDRVFVAYPTGLGEYEYSSKEINTWDAVNSLSDITISCLGYSSSTNSVFVGYDNGNVDKIRNNKLTNIPAIKLAQVQGSKRINKIVEYGGFMYFATGFAIVKIDPIKDEVRDTYYPTNGNSAILDVAFKNDSIYAITEQRMYVGAINNIALADPAQWYEDVRVPVIVSSSIHYAEVETVNDSLFLLLKVDGYGLDTLYQVLNNQIVPQNQGFTVEINSIVEVNNQLAINYFPGTLLYDADLLGLSVLTNYSSGDAPNLNSLSYRNGTYWLADNDIGLVEYKSDGSSQAILIEGPPVSDAFKLYWSKGQLVVSAGGLTGVSQTYNNKGIYVFEDEKWTAINQDNQTKWATANIWDYLSISINPVNEGQIAVGTFSEVPLSITNTSGVVTDTFTINNSILEPTNPLIQEALISDLKYDEQGNLWMLNGYSLNPLKVYTKDKQWIEFPISSAVTNKFMYDINIDYNGNKWFALRDGGLYGYNDNGTITNTSDDKFVYLNTGDFSGALPSNNVNAIAVDFDNEIWIGTDNGFAVLYNSEGSFDAAPGEYNAQRIKLEFEGNVEYVLGATRITDIEVDGANRKWFATDNSGIILLSPDGLEILEHHTVENSPLISNNVLDLALDQSTGELFIITDKGLVSYRTDATYEDPEYSDVVVFPNPARPEFDGPITIQGIRYNSDVKITDVAGKLVYKTTSNGGTATWDGKTLDGERVSTGVYLIWTAANEGKGRKVGKVVVVN
ncbi:MAG: T9SS type A sorting domain-containing protein [Fluviicola sp.]|nr:T9SS type A sorting domain-containing protein [Fluviicola sp.]